ncbi:hypothetical protein VOLCADRAFT_92679 [Volvox carteri f. nagariensis]|uniref:Uncharacterized protein n=1 Tax=Volvox carteri f. nagariensis TaxID=3068 RepID=D8U089_VOLCA|nr:uncharacterized protein VOLCADRAFT_92679 [Volvox carteri f. nagariensis]EFJ46899.1 hypothetical protein VOLCADRAFT_92679 [Volvox carteri f. nagariensis]|eukprot:XP_002952108.1 hypothetical protein VOLCADRAFT_92679 [Volvox carteri f. nagariensis]
MALPAAVAEICSAATIPLRPRRPPRRITPPPAGIIGNNRRQLAGQLVFSTVDQPGTQWLVRDSDGVLISLGKGYQPPARDLNGEPLLPGSVVQLNMEGKRDNMDSSDDMEDGLSQH